MRWGYSIAVLLLGASSSSVAASSPGAAFDIGIPIVSGEGYEWTNRQRSYWPTNKWISGSASDFGLDAGRLDDALEFAQNDALMRAVLMFIMTR